MSLIMKKRKINIAELGKVNFDECGFDIPHSDIPNIRVYDAPDFARVLQQPLEDNKQKFLQIQTCFKSVVFQLLV